MKLLSLSVVLILTTAPAHAISRYNSMEMSCASAQAAVSREGAVIFRHASARNPSLTLYDRYVAHGGYCAAGEYAANAWIPTADRAACFVRTCKQNNYDDDILFK